MESFNLWVILKSNDNLSEESSTETGPARIKQL